MTFKQRERLKFDQLNSIYIKMKDKNTYGRSVQRPKMVANDNGNMGLDRGSENVLDVLA